MLIKNIELVDEWKQAKHKIYSIIRQLNTSFQPFSPIYLYIFNFATLLPNSAILFKYSDPFPTVLSDIFRLCLITNITNIFAINSHIIAAIILVYSFLIVLLSAFHFIFASVFSFCTKLLNVMLKLSLFFGIPLVDYAVHCYSHISDDITPLTLKGLYIATLFMLVLLGIILMIYLKFNIRMIRKKNSLWNIDNDLHLYGFIYLAFKASFLSVYPPTISICFLSLVVWNFHREMPGGCVGIPQKIIEFSPYNYIAAADLGVLLSIVAKNPFFGLNIWIFALGSFIIYSCLQIYKARRSRLFIPICSSPPEIFYHFFYCFKQEFKGDDMGSLLSKKSYSSVYQLHRIHCNKDQCKLPPPSIQQNEEAVGEAIANLIASRKQESLSNRLVWQLWNLEMGRKCQIQHLGQKSLTLKQDFILYSIESLTRDSEVTIRTSQSNKSVVSKVFYDLIYEISSDYAQFYEELGRTHPKVDAIVRIGVGIRKKVGKLKAAYAELLRSRLINFKMIELYLQFFTNFVKEDVLDKDSVARLMKVQQHMHFEDIAENYLPTLTLYPDTGNLQNANSEAQKFLKSTRFQLKYRNVSDLLLPAPSIENLRTLLGKDSVEYDDEPVYSFFKKSDKDYGCGTIRISQRYVKQKKLLIMQIVKQPYSDLKCLFLLDSDFKVLLMSRQSVKIKAGSYRNAPLELKWQWLFEKYIIDSQEKLLKTKMAKISTDNKGCILIIKKLNSLIESSHILLVQLIIANENTKQRKESILQNRRSFQAARKQSHFEFHYAEDDRMDKVTILGYKEEMKIDRTRTKFRTLDKFEKELQATVVDGLLIQSEHLGRDIKTYRLFGGDLFNVDLEDRQAYNEIFAEHFSQSKKKEVSEQSSLECYIFMGVILLGLGLIAFSVALIIKFQGSSLLIEDQYSKYQNIESFNIDFQRMLTLLRDQASGLMLKFPQVNGDEQIQQSYGRIQTLKNDSLFDNKQYTIFFQDLTMTGTLSELVDVMLAHVTEILDSKDLSIIEDVHETCIVQLNNMIALSQQDIVSSISGYIDDLTLLKNVLLYSSIALVLFIYFLMVLYCVKSNYKAKDKLADLMFISDTEAKLLQENAQKMKYAVQMARKNFDVDTQNLLASGGEFKKRKNPKEAMLSRQIVYSIGGVTIIGFIVHIVCLFVFSSVFASQVSNFQSILSQGEHVTSIYPRSCELINEIDHKGILNQPKLDSIRNSLSELEHSMNNLLFSPELNAFITTIYFENSCPVLYQRYNYSLADCAVTVPGFRIVNPFQVGLALYYHRQNFYVSNNLTENYGYTGVFSMQFARVYTNLTALIKREGITALEQTFITVALLNGFIILIDCTYIFAFLVIYRYFRNQFAKIKEILFFFSIRLTRHEEDSDVSDEETIKEERSDEGKPLREDKPNNKRRRTTIEKKIDLE